MARRWGVVIIVAAKSWFKLQVFGGSGGSIQSFSQKSFIC